MLTSLHLHMKSKRVCIKTRSPPASLPLKGQVTRHTTVKWPIKTIQTKSSSEAKNLLLKGRNRLMNTGSKRLKRRDQHPCDNIVSIASRHETPMNCKLHQFFDNKGQKTRHCYEE